MREVARRGVAGVFRARRRGVLRGRVPAVVAAVAAGALVVGVLPALSGSGLTSAADGADAAASWQPGDAAVSGPLASGTLPGVASAVEYAYGVDYAGGTEGAGAAIAGAGATVTILQGDTLSGSAAAWNTGDDASASVSVAPVAAEEISGGGGASLADVLQTAPLPDTGAGAAQLRWEIPAAEAAVVNTGAQPTPLAVTGPEGASAQTSVFVAQPQLEVVLEVSADGGTTWAGEASAPEGAEVVWRVTATNTGNVDLTDVKVATATANDTDTLDAGLGAEIGALPVGETGSATFTTEAGDIAAGVSVSGVFDAEGPDGAPLVDRFTDAAGTVGRVPSNTATATLAEGAASDAPVGIAPLSSAISGGTRLTSSMSSGGVENAGASEMVRIATQFFAYVPEGGSLQLDLNLARTWGNNTPVGSWDGLKLYVQSPSGVKTLVFDGLPATFSVGMTDLPVMTFTDPEPGEAGGVWRIWWQDASGNELVGNNQNNASDGGGVYYLPDSTIAPRDSSGVALSGQVWTDLFMGNSADVATLEPDLLAGRPTNNYNPNIAYNRSMYSLSEQGVLYRNLEFAFNGHQYQVHTDNFGIVGAAPADVCARLNRSTTLNAGQVPVGQNGRYNVSSGCPGFVQYKLFLQEPNPAMPASAKWFDGSTRPLYPAYEAPTAELVSYAQTAPVTSGNYGGNFTVELTGGPGTAKLEIDVDADGTVDRTITLPAGAGTTAGTHVVSWDGLTGSAVQVKLSQKVRARVVWDVPSYVYFISEDVEGRVGGIVSTMLRGPADYIGSHRLLWDDSIFEGQPNSQGNPLVGIIPDPVATTGIDSSPGVHRWGEFDAGPIPFVRFGGWGDARLIQDRTDFEDDAFDVLDVDPAAPIIRVGKSVPGGRWNDADQFTVSLREGSVSGASRASVTTAGAATSAVSAPYTGAAGTAYYVTEAGSGGADLANYVKTITCVDANHLQTGLPNGAAFDPAAGFRLVPVGGTDITCTVTNSVIPSGAFQVLKTGENGDGWVPMQGSRWGLFLDDGGSVTDHSAVPPAVIDAVDPVGGQASTFLVRKVKPGSYFLVELEAPAGFSLLAQPLRVTVSNTGVVTVDPSHELDGTVVFTPASGETPARVEVRDVPSMSLPVSGGPGSWWVYGLGGVLAAAGMVGAVVSWRLRRRAAGAGSVVGLM